MNQICSITQMVEVKENLRKINDIPWTQSKQAPRTIEIRNQNWNTSDNNCIPNQHLVHKVKRKSKHSQLNSEIFDYNSWCPQRRVPLVFIAKEINDKL